MLFDESFYFPISELDNNDNNPKLVNPEVGLSKGNMFSNEYIPYKNYNTTSITVISKQEQMLLKIMELCFAINDLNLFLDINPDNKELLELFKKYVTKEAALEVEYINTYGPLVVNNSVNTKEFDWIVDPWPWDSYGGSRYV